MSSQAFTRRAFAVMTAAGWSRVAGANERVRVGIIGAGGRGDKLLEELLKIDSVSVTAVCDLHAERRNLAQRMTGGSARAVDDYRRVLDDPDVDAVVIATPDHWHAIQFVDACDAGKDIYVEKPLSLTVAEGAVMVAAARRGGRVVQAGTQRRSSAMVRQAVELIQSGGIGKVTAARAFDNLNEWPAGIGFAPDEPVPEGLDWDRYLGPAPLRPYNRNRIFYNFRWFSDYSGGQLANNGIHLMDVIRWALDLGWPRKVAAMGGIYALQDGREIPDTLEVMWEFEGGVLVSFSQYNANEAPMNSTGASLEFRGTKGTLYVLPDRFEVIPEPVSSRLRYRSNPLDRSNTRARWMSARKPAIEKRVVTGAEIADAEHVRNFVQCVRSRAACSAGIEAAHRSTSTCLIGNIALKTESTLAWDGARQRFTNHDAANKLLHYRYRSPYELRGIRDVVYG